MAQRLMRKICSKCKAPTEIHHEALREVGINPDQAEGKTFYHGTGCIECGNSGYKGRTGIYEVMPITQKIRTHILDGANTKELEDAAVSEGMMTLRMNAMKKFERGISTIEEVMRVTGDT